MLRLHPNLTSGYHLVFGKFETMSFSCSGSAARPYLICCFSPNNCVCDGRYQRYVILLLFSHMKSMTCNALCIGMHQSMLHMQMLFLPWVTACTQNVHLAISTLFQDIGTLKAIVIMLNLVLIQKLTYMILALNMIKV